MRIGVDLGGTKIEAIALADDGRVLDRRRVPTPRRADGITDAYAATLDAIAALVTEVERAVGATGSVGVGIPGAISAATGLVKNANSTALIGHPFDRDLAARLGRPVRVTNDANCFALSEAADGAGAGADVVFGVILGTGVGGGLVVHGRVLDGANRIAGEWGHDPMPWPEDDERPGPPCYCGRAGCIETFLSGPGFKAEHARRLGLDPAAPNAPDAPSIVAAALGGDPAAAASLERWYARLARALAAVVNVLDPDVVVLGGGMSNVPRVAEEIARRLPAHVFSDTVVTRVVPNVHGDSSGVRGAAWLWPVRTA